MKKNIEDLFSQIWSFFTFFFLPKTSKDKIHAISEQTLNIFRSVAKAKSSCLKDSSMF